MAYILANSASRQVEAFRDARAAVAPPPPEKELPSTMMSEELKQRKTIEFLKSRAELGSVATLDAESMDRIRSKVPPHLVNINPAAEEDDLKRKVLIAKRNYVDSLEKEIADDYVKTFKAEQCQLPS